LHPDRFQVDGASSVEMVDRYKLRYREGDRVLYVAQDLQADPHEVVIDRQSLKAWEPPNEKDRLDETDKDRIIENMRRAFVAQGYHLFLIDE
jgi:hypothetical protein